MRWQDEGLLLSVSRYGEGSARLSVLTRERGLWNGLARSQARGKSLASFPVLGTRLAVSWSARLESHLGHFRLETLSSSAARLFDVPLSLLALQSLCALSAQAMPEREPCPEFYNELLALISFIATSASNGSLADGSLADDSKDGSKDGSKSWFAPYLRWENRLLSACGFSLDLSRCCASGRLDDLAFLSPRTGRAISRAALDSPQVAPYRERLLTLPAILLSQGNTAGDTAGGHAGGHAGDSNGNGRASREPISLQSWCEGLRVLGYFIGKFTHPLPNARVRLLELAQKLAQNLAQSSAQSLSQDSQSQALQTQDLTQASQTQDLAQPLQSAMQPSSYLSKDGGYEQTSTAGDCQTLPSGHQ